MKKRAIFVFLSLFMLLLIGIVIAANTGAKNGNVGLSNSGASIMPNENNSQIVGGQRDEHGCLGPAGYSWNETENKCVREWETGEERYQHENNGLGQIIRNRIKAGVYISETGEEIKVSEMAQNKIQLRVRNISADCDCNLSEEKIQNRTRLKMQLKNESDFDIKIMPDVANERALERLRIRNCNESNNCTLQLKEVKKGNQTRAAYEIQVQRHSKLLGMFKIKAQQRIQVDAETGDIISVKKPWWNFLATEQEE